MKRILALFLIICMLSGCAVQPANTPPAGEQNETVTVPSGDQSETASDTALTVHVLDVGQGDSTLISLPDGRCMLIDAGEREYGERVCDYLRGLGIKRIDFLVGTHPHSDHIGGLQQVVENFDIGAVYMPKKAHTTTTFTNLLLAVKNKGLSVNTAIAGKNIALGENWSVDILSPVSEDYGDNLNLYSVVIRITHGSQKLLFMGDAETENEEQLADVSADFIRVGHHGSNTSSGAEFVRRVGAKYAVVSVGRDNSYNLPKENILQRWQDSGAAVYRTDELGTIVVRSDGVSLTLEAAEEVLSGGSAVTTPQNSVSTAATFVLNISSKKIHLPDCGSVDRMSEKNKQTTIKTLQSLLDEGYTCCGSCQPDIA